MSKTLIKIENIIRETILSLNTKIIKKGKIKPAVIELNDTYFVISNTTVKIDREIKAPIG
jgi:hypothetical protein